MKIKVLSDIHLEKNDFEYEHHGEDVVCLVGDIGEGILGALWALKNITVPIIYVAGNHEYYSGLSFEEVNHALKMLEEQHPKRFYFMNNDSVFIGDVEFIGGTMWTDFASFGLSEQWFAIQQAKSGIIDFSIIKYKNRIFNPHDAIDQFNEFEKLIDFHIKNKSSARKRVVMSHFCPSRQSIPKRFNTNLLSVYWASNLEHKIPFFDYWLHGHTHDNFDYMVGECRVICNPRGFAHDKYDALANNLEVFRPDYVIEV